MTNKRRSTSYAGRLVALLLFCLALLASCADEPVITPEPTPEPTIVLLENDVPDDAASNGESRQLVLWLPEFFNPAQDTTAGAILEGAFFQFEQNHPGLSIDVQIKAEYGQAGLLNYLRAAQRAAPAIMPDVVLLHSSQLWQVADLGIVPPLQSSEAQFDQEFFPFSLEALTYRDQLYGVPYITNILHAVTIPETEPTPENAASENTMPEDTGSATETPATDTETDTETAATAILPPTNEEIPTVAESLGQGTPVNWDALLAGEGYYVFPAGGVESFRLASAVMHYRAAGGELVAEGAPAADIDTLETFFEFLVLARQQGIIPELVLEYSTYESLWSAFDGLEGDFALISAQEFLHQSDMAEFQYIPVPTTSSEPATIGNAWGFAVLSREEEQRALAFELIEHLLAPDIQGPWSQAELRLPSQPEALARWGGAQSDYVTFLESQFSVVDPIPTGRAFADFTRHLHLAQAGVLRGELSVEEAIQEARTID